MADRDLAWFLDRIPDDLPPDAVPLTAGEMGRQSIEAFIAARIPKETTVSEPTEPQQDVPDERAATREDVRALCTLWASDARRAPTSPQDGPNELVEVGAQALRDQAAQCLDEDCPLTEQECWESHPVNWSGMAAGNTRIEGPADSVARVVLAAVLPAYIERVLTAAADQLDAMPETDGAALKGPYWYRDGWKQATGMLRDWADYPAALADRLEGDTL
jgi:hypothetical protein